MTKLLGTTFCLLLGFITALPARGQDKQAESKLVEVTFYSTGDFWKASLPGYKYGMFSGPIFDNKQQLVNITPGHFVTFNLSPGTHIFSTNYWLAQTSKGGAHLKIDLVANQHYYIGTYLKTTPLLMVSTPHIEQTTCNEAQKHAASSKPLGIEHIKEEAIPLAVSETYFPQCS